MQCLKGMKWTGAYRQARLRHIFGGKKQQDCVQEMLLLLKRRQISICLHEPRGMGISGKINKKLLTMVTYIE